MTSTYYPTVKAARILYDSDRSSASSSDDAAVVGWVKTNKFILAISIAYGAKDITAATFKLQWENVTDAGSYADVAATGEVKYAATSSVLVNSSVVTSTEKRNSYTGGYTWQDGEESVNDNITGSIS